MQERYIEVPSRFLELRAMDINKSSIGSHIAQAKRNLRSPCPDCKYDPINKESTNPGCNTCGGAGVINVVQTIILPCLVSLNNSSETIEQIGVLAQENCRLIMTFNMYHKYSKYLQPKNRIYIGTYFMEGYEDMDTYEIRGRVEHGPGRSQGITIYCDKILEPAEAKE